MCEMCEICKNALIPYYVNTFMELDESVFKEVLWRLCYEPDAIFEEYGIEEDIDVSTLQDEMLKSYLSQNDDFVFGSKEPKLDTLGVDFRGINPIVRDTIIEKCSSISDDQMYLRMCIYDICLRRSDPEFENRKRAGFDSLGFSEKEQSYLERTINTYCIGDFLKAIQQEKYPNRKKLPPREEVRRDTIKNPSNSENAQLDKTVLIENKDPIEAFIMCYNGTEFVNPVILLENLDKVSILIERANELKKKGIEPCTVINKAGEINALYQAIGKL